MRRLSAFIMLKTAAAQLNSDVMSASIRRRSKGVHSQICPHRIVLRQHSPCTY